MSLIRTIVFCLLFAVAAGVYLYQERLQKLAFVNVPDEVNREVSLARTDNILQIEILDHKKKNRIVLKREGAQWLLDFPVRYPAETRLAQGLAMTARWFVKQPRLRGEREWQEYGLAKPEFEIIYSVEGKKSERLLIGAKSPVADAYFARWESERGYFLMPGPAKASLQQSVYGLREKRVFRLPEEEIREIYVEMGKNSYQWKKDKEEWYWFEPVAKFGKKIAKDRMNLILSALQDLYIKEYLDDNKKTKAELGFFIIHDRIRMKTSTGKSEVLHFGDEVPDRNAYYGLREGEDVVFLVDRGKVFEFWDLLQAVEKGKILTPGESPR